MTRRNAALPLSQHKCHLNLLRLGWPDAQAVPGLQGIEAPLAPAVHEKPSQARQAALGAWQPDGFSSTIPANAASSTGASKQTAQWLTVPPSRCPLAATSVVPCNSHQLSSAYGPYRAYTSKPCTRHNTCTCRGGLKCRWYAVQHPQGEQHHHIHGPSAAPW